MPAPRARAREAASAARQPPDLEQLAFHFQTDKSHDDHKYVDLYSALFDPIRHDIRNVTEIGAAAGQSLQVWHEYFPAARLWGVDNYISGELRQVIRHVTLAPFVGHDNLQPFFGNARSVGLLASEIIQKTHPLAPFEHP